MPGLVRQGRHQHGYPQTSQRERDDQEAKELVEEDAQQQAEKNGKPNPDKLKADIDDLLDEIDELIDEQDVMFAKRYVQKGGQ